ncbi:hypothetical protein EDB86DRAFT_2969565 [Lactarius hatsudake]|nr:hypothetical protein EDB86DRAFT_2969565 [Lactarius hatsudake]
MDSDTEFHPTNNVDAERIRGIYKDSSGKLWSIYLAEADEYDEEITELWRGEADSILVFTGLFSGVISTFLSMSYNDLFPNLTYTTNALLAQVSQQIVDISKGLPPQSDPTLVPTLVNDLVFTPPPSAIRVNIIWFLSLVLSIVSALNATLFQQWARRYLEVTRRREAPHKRARTRAYMFDGVKSFKMSRAVKAMPMLLHLSIFLFFAGLIDFLWNTNSTVGHWVLGFILAFAFAYFALTVLPNLYLDCPYSTPLSELSWRLSQHLFLLFLRLTQGLEDILLSYRSSSGQPTYQLMEGSSWWTQWRKAVKTRINERRQWLKVGLQDSIMLNATHAPSTTDENALSWTLTVLDDDREFEDFVARVPGFFDSASVLDASSVMRSLMDDQSSRPDEFDPVLGSRINDLLKTCVPGTSPLKEELRKNRLRVCMRTLWYFAREYNQLGNTTPLPPYVRSTFAEPEMSRRIQLEDDLAARLIGRCFSSLVAQKLAQDISSRTGLHARVSPAELACLAAILDKTSLEVADLLSEPGGIGLTNIVSLMSSEAHTLVEGSVPLEVLDIFIQTLDKLFAEVPPDAELPRDLVAVLHETTPLGQRSQVLDLRVDRLRQIVEELSAVRDEAEATGLAMPQTELRHGPATPTNTSSVSLLPDEGSGVRDQVRDSLLRNATL